MGNLSQYHYWSPKALDLEEDKIEMRIRKHYKYDFLNVTPLANDSFMVQIDREDIGHKDEGIKEFVVELDDENHTTSVTKNTVLVEIIYVPYYPRIVYRFPIDFNNTVLKSIHLI